MNPTVDATGAGAAARARCVGPLMPAASDGAHVAVLHRDPGERDASLLRYIAEAQQAGETAVCITESGRPPSADTTRGVDAVQWLSTAETYLRGGGFDADAMAAWVAEMVASAPAAPSPRTRIAGDLGWARELDSHGFDELFRYEATLDRLAPTSRHTYACFYSLAELAARHLIEVLRTHPWVIIDGALWDSPLYRRADGAAARQAVPGAEAAARAR